MLITEEELETLKLINGLDLTVEAIIDRTTATEVESKTCLDKLIELKTQLFSLIGKDMYRSVNDGN